MPHTTGEYYTNNKTQLLIVFDVRIPGATERFSRERAAWEEDAVVEMLDLDHPVLIVKAGGAERLAR